MFKRLVLTAALVTVFATPAFAGQCPKLAHQIDAALETSMVDDATKEKIQAMRDEGMALHDAGQHAESEKVLTEALQELTPKAQ